MIKILFICHGNICRSPMAEFIMRDMAEKSGVADKFYIETQVVDAGFASPLTDHNSEPFALVERAVSAVFPGTITTPYIMTAASDCRFFSRFCDHCLRFTPFHITNDQMSRVHGTDENLDLSALVPAVEFYKYIMKEV